MTSNFAVKRELFEKEEKLKRLASTNEQKDAPKPVKNARWGILTLMADRDGITVAKLQRIKTKRFRGD